VKGGKPNRDDRKLAGGTRRRMLSVPRRLICAFLLLVIASPVVVTPAHAQTDYMSSAVGSGSSNTLGLLNQPKGVAVDASGNIYVADAGNCVVWEVPHNGQPAFAFAGMFQNCSGIYSSANPTAISLNAPVDVAVCNNTLFIADTSSASSNGSGLHAINLATNAFSNLNLTFTNTPGLVGNVQPQAIACDSAGDLFAQSVLQTQDSNLPTYRLDMLSAGGFSSVIDEEGFGIVFQGIAVDTSHVSGSDLIYAYTVGGSGTVQTIQKFTYTFISPNYVWEGPFPISQSRPLVGSTRLALDGVGNFYVTEAPITSPLVPVYITEVSPQSTGYTVTYVGGTGVLGAGTDALALADTVALANPAGIAIDGSDVLFAHTGNNRVRRIHPVIPGPTSLSRSAPLPLNTYAGYGQYVINPVTNDFYYIQNSNEIYVLGNKFNASYETLEAIIPIGEAGFPGSSPITLIVDPSRNLVYANNAADGNVYVINGATLQVIDNVAINNPNATLLAIDPALNQVYVAGPNSPSVSVIQGPVGATPPQTSYECRLPRRLHCFPGRGSEFSQCLCRLRCVRRKQREPGRVYHDQWK